jgi:hypothetical protein
MIPLALAGAFVAGSVSTLVGLYLAARRAYRIALGG